MINPSGTFIGDARLATHRISCIHHVNLHSLLSLIIIYDLINKNVLSKKIVSIVKISGLHVFQS